MARPSDQALVASRSSHSPVSRPKASILRAASDKAAEVFEEIDALSRTRALTEPESLKLEWAISKLTRGRSNYGLNKELARHGVRGWQ